MSESLVTIIMPEGKFEYLKSILSNHRDFIHKLGIAKPLKDSLIKDIHIIKTIVETNKKSE